MITTLLMIPNSSIIHYHYYSSIMILRIPNSNKKSDNNTPNGGFLKWGGTPKSSIFYWIFHEINHPAVGDSPFMETSK